MKLPRLLLSAALTASTLCSSALNPLPTDPEVRTGRLPNGLTYYIRHNDTPARQADFYIAMSVGSVNEEENQRGLAHFLEHMCFNGTRHFPGRSLISYLESLGVKFGANLNAYTSTDETVYNICQVPTMRQSALDSCLLILRDWSHDLTLDPKEIDAERGVIKGEWRQRSSQASSRLLEKALPDLYPGSAYGHRMPIGRMEVVESFRPKQLRDYYKKWYHPLNQCVIIVGDIDPDHTEREIRRLWADVKAPRGAAPSILPAVPGNSSPIAAVHTDPEQTATVLSLYIKHPSLPDSLANTIEALRRDAIRSMVCEMLAERLTEAENAPDSPIRSTAIGDRHFMLSRGQEALTLRTPVRPGRTADAVAALAGELKRAASAGFLPSEFERARIAERSAADKEHAARHSTTNTDYARRYVRHYLDGGSLSSADQTYKMLKGVISGIKIEDCNSYMASLIRPGDADVVMSAYLPAADPTSSGELVSAYVNITPGSLAPYIDRAADGQLLEAEPTEGSILTQTELPQFGATMLTLSNGIKVYLRPSAEQPDKIIITADSPGGFSQKYDPATAADCKIFNDAIAVSATGRFSAEELRRHLVGKQIKVRLDVDNMKEGISASSSRADLADAFRLIHLKATDMRPDSTAFARLLDNTLSRLTDTSSNPTFAMGDSIHAYVYDRHPLGMKLTPARLATIDYSRILDIYADRFGDMSDFSFFITGDFDPDSIRPFIERYIASLPGAGRVERPRDIGYRYATTPDSARFTMPMQTPQSIAYSFYYAPCEYTLSNRVAAQITGTILQNKLRDDLREKRGWTYGVKTHIGLNIGYNGDDPTLAIMPVYIRVAPENAARTFEIVDSTMRSLADPSTILPSELAKIKEYMAKNYAQARLDNGYWESVMRIYDRYGIDMNCSYLEALDAVTPETIARFAASTLLPSRRLRLEMAPTD